MGISSYPSDPSSSAGKKNWLERYITVQQASDRQLTQVLQGSLEAAGLAMQALEAKAGIGAQVRRTQLLGARGSLTKVLTDLYKLVGDNIREGQSKAAGAAAEAAFKDELKILRVIEPNEEKRNALTAAMQAQAERNAKTVITRVFKSELPLSRKIYKSQAFSKDQLGRVINNHLARGSSAADMAKDVRAFFDPRVPGGVSAAARRLARTEINNAFHAQAIDDIQDRPWVTQANWHLSKSHPAKQRYDKCDEYARMGTFAADKIPPKPHPNCLCYVVPVIPDLDTVINDALAGKYREWELDNVGDSALQ